MRVTMMSVVGLLVVSLAAAAEKAKVDVAVENVEGLAKKYTERSTISMTMEITADVQELEQAVVVFTHKETKREVFFTLAHKRKQIWGIDVDLVRFADEAFLYQSGTYTVHAIVSDASFKKPIEKELGSANLVLTATPLFKQRMEFSEMKDWVRRKPQTWDMTPEEERASPMMSLLGVVGLAFPPVVLIGLLLNAGADISGFTSSGKTFARASIFHGCLIADCALIVCYWISLPFFPTAMMMLASSTGAFIFRPRATAKVAKTKEE